MLPIFATALNPDVTHVSTAVQKSVTCDAVIAILWADIPVTIPWVSIVADKLCEADP